MLAHNAQPSCTPCFNVPGLGSMPCCQTDISKACKVPMHGGKIAVTSAGATDRCSDEVGGDAVWRHCAGVDDLAVSSPQLQPGRVQVQVAPLECIPLLLPVQHPLQPLPSVTGLQCGLCLTI